MIAFFPEKKDAGFNRKSILPGNETAAYCVVQLKNHDKLHIITHSDCDDDFLETRWRGFTVSEFAYI